MRVASISVSRRFAGLCFSSLVYSFYLGNLYRQTNSIPYLEQWPGGRGHGGGQSFADPAFWIVGGDAVRHSLLYRDCRNGDAEKSAAFSHFCFMAKDGTYFDMDGSGLEFGYGGAKMARGFFLDHASWSLGGILPASIFDGKPFFDIFSKPDEAEIKT